MRLPSSGTPFSFVREPLPRPPRALYPATPPQMAVSALQRSSSDPHAIVPYSRIQPVHFARAQSAGELAIAAMKEDQVHTASIYAAGGAESRDYPAPSSPLKARNEQKAQRRRPKTSSPEADSARHGQRHQLQQAKADDDAHCAKERIQQWLRDSGQLHQQAAPTALQGKTSGV